MYRPSQTPHLAVSSEYGSRQGPSPRPGVPAAATAAGPPKVTAPPPGTAGRPRPRFDARSPRLALNATGISTAARLARAQADGARDRVARGRRAGGRRPDAPAAGTARSALPSKWGNDASSGISRSTGRRPPRGRPPGPPTPTYATPRHVSEQCQIRVKLNRVFFPR
jgi:hypothetical protein